MIIVSIIAQVFLLWLWVYCEIIGFKIRTTKQKKISKNADIIVDAKAIPLIYLLVTLPGSLLLSGTFDKTYEMFRTCKQNQLWNMFFTILVLTKFLMKNRR